MFASVTFKSLTTYSHRWIFGLGVSFFLFAIGGFATNLKQTNSAFTYSSERSSYRGVIIGIPEQKSQTIACPIILTDTDKKVMCYFKKGVRSDELSIGDEVFFHGKIVRFKHFTDPDEFDYPQYMYRKGYSGSIYLTSGYWETSGRKDLTLESYALMFREEIISFYESLGFEDSQLAVLSALTLGYKSNLSEDVIQGFRTTGTAHVLAVSGMHILIIYGFIFSLLRGRLKESKVLQCSVILLLWIYAFVVGLPASVIRAVLFISIFAVSRLLNKKGFSYNNIAIAAFFMLLLNPFYLFDLGFQLSFAAVLSIRIIQPMLYGLINVSNFLFKSIWSVFTLSIAAQVGTFPLALYYFGTFPTYFFLTNIVIVPMVSLVIYILLSIVGCKFVSLAIVPVEKIQVFIVDALIAVIDLMLLFIRFFERLPFALIDNIKIDFLQVIFIYAGIGCFIVFVKTKKSRLLICSQMAVCAVFVYSLWSSIIPKTELLLVDHGQSTSLILKEKGVVSSIDSLINGYYVEVENVRLLSIGNNAWEGKMTNILFNINYLHLRGKEKVSLYSLTQVISVDKVVLDGSLSANHKKRLIKECEKLGFPYYDMSEKGIFRIKF